MRNIVFFFLLLTIAVQAQTIAEGPAIMKPITALFTGMNLGDSALVRSAFAKEVTMATVTIDKSGSLVVRRESSLSGFLKAVGTPHADPWSEPIWDAKIEVDGNFAQVWASYAFFVGKRFSHCGVDAFQLAKYGSEWKIIHLADTRHTTGCTVPDSIRDQFK
jgi:Putative lumazine-binding